jgi:hypothetical protein
MPDIVRISPARPMKICTAPAEGSSFWRICRVADLGAGFEGGLTGELLVDVDAIVLSGGVFVAAGGPEVGVDMVLYHLMR